MQYSITLPDNFETCDLSTLLEKHWLVPRKVRHFLRTRRNVQVNGEITLFHEEVNALDSITLTFEETDYNKPNLLEGDASLVDVRFEDAHIIVVEKPINMKTHPNDGYEEDALQNHVAAYLSSKNELPYVVHRLDKDTSGLVMFAKNPFVLPILSRMMEQKDIHRSYQALVQGNVKPTEQTIDAKIGRDRHDTRMQTIDEYSGKTAITHVTVLNASPQQSLVKCDLETGRTHQIRVHLESIGHPIIGDPLYNYRSNATRLMLHAYQLSFVHPFTGETILCESPNNLN